MLNQIDEVKYLVQENTERYRLIMQFLFSKYEEADSWQYKEDIYEAVVKIINDYTLEECERDLNFLLANGSIDNLQNTKNINTMDEFKLRKFRYQITDKAVIIERMTKELEELEIKVTSLEPRLFERINSLIKRLTNTYELDENQIYAIWTDLNSDFKNLNEHYKDFLKKFHEAKTEELLKSEAFLEFKSGVINYINNFINSYIKNATQIKKYLLEIDNEKTEYLMNSLISYQKKVPKVSSDFNYEKLKKVNYGKWQSIVKWFIPITNISEGERLLEATQNIIQKIYKYASSLLELHGNMINRKEEYIHICRLFDNLENIEDAHKLSATIFGVFTTNHYKMSSLVKTDSLIKSYAIPPYEIPINTINKEYKIRNSEAVIIDKTQEKERILEKARQKEELRKEKIKNLIKNGIINLENEVILDEEERRYVLDLIEKYNNKKTKESEFGYYYYITNEQKEKCKIISPDGIFELNKRTIKLEIGDING